MDTYDSETGNCKADYYDSETQECISPYYASNVNKMKQAFGTLATDDNICYYGSSHSYCSLPGLYVHIRSGAAIGVIDGSWSCEFNEGDGYSDCNE